MPSTLTKQDSRLLTVKIKEAFKDTDFRRDLRNQFNLNKVKCPKNKSKNTEIKLIQCNVDDSMRLTKDEVIVRFLNPIFNAIKENLQKGQYNSCFEINQNFLNRADYKIDINEFEMIKINDFVFYYSIVQCKKESFEYEFQDVDLERDISEDELKAIKKEAKFKEEYLNSFDVRFLFPVKALAERKLKNKL